MGSIERLMMAKNQVGDTLNKMGMLSHSIPFRADARSIWLRHGVVGLGSDPSLSQDDKERLRAF
jgi:hypothetical protein